MAADARPRDEPDPPEVSVVVSSHNRSARLRRLLASLRKQTLDRDRFEVIVVDNASTDDTPDVIAAAKAAGELRIRGLRRDTPGGPALGREKGWRAAAGPLIAFCDDDVEADPAWLEAGIAAWSGETHRFVQGRTEPNPAELGDAGAFSRTIAVRDLDPHFNTCNLFVPRALLEEVGGFDVDAFPARPAGEDTDLAWRAIGAGGEPVFAADALVHHAVNQLGPLGKLRVAARWSDGMRVYARHPELRRQVFTYGVFWKREHFWLALALCGLLLPRRLRLLGLALTIPYLRSARARGLEHGHAVLLAPYWLAHDLVEMGGVARGGISAGSPML
jgi:glycosyltransferase involved in cell wall biosynthesis